jgi:hypothetical protein
MPRLINVNSVNQRLMLVLPDMTVNVPSKHTAWLIQAMAALPTYGYMPPDGASDRNARSYGDIQIVHRDQAHLRTSVLTLMDRYWGRYNLNPGLPDLVTKIQHANHAAISAPRIASLVEALGNAVSLTREYVIAMSGLANKPVEVKGGQSFTVEWVPCEGFGGESFKGRNDIEVELLIVTMIPVD